MAEPLAQRFHVVAPDLRGYGDSTGPEPGPSGENYTFRDMASEQVAVMEALGYRRFYVAGHDRGGRTAHRMALDHPTRVLKLALVDILPTHHIWQNFSREWALKSWHWIFMAQQSALAERMIGGIPAGEFLPAVMSRPGIGLSIFAPDAYQEYLRCFTPKMIRASCSDYRACATIGARLDEVDAARLVECPTLVVWGTQSHTSAVFKDVLAVWRQYCADVTGGPLEGGHFIPEQAPAEMTKAFIDFFQ